MKQIELKDFNNLTKTLTFNIYDFFYIHSSQQLALYHQYIRAKYNAQYLTRILQEVNYTIGASILHIAQQDYKPQGASVNVLICEAPIKEDKEISNGYTDTLLAHLDKSHISVHTYPELEPYQNIASVRVDIDVSTCGTISPLQALNFLIRRFNSDIVMLDYRIRGFTRDIRGKKHYMDHSIVSIQDFLALDIQKMYQVIDKNVPEERNFHTKMRVKTLNLEQHCIGNIFVQLKRSTQRVIYQSIQKEMQDIFDGIEA